MNSKSKGAIGCRAERGGPQRYFPALALILSIASIGIFRSAQAADSAVVHGDAVHNEITRDSESDSSSTSGVLVEEVLAHSIDPHQYDWRRSRLQIDLGYAFFNELNSFKGADYDLGFSTALPFGRGWIGRLELRRVEIQATSASATLAQTPFSQAGQPSHDEILLGAAYTLLEGRSLTPWSPRLTDVGHAFYALGGLQYNYFSSKDPEPIAGLRAIYYNLVAETGVRFQVFLPNALGVALEWTYSIPLQAPDPDLPSWQRIGGNISWSFGL